MKLIVKQKGHVCFNLQVGFFRKAWKLDAASSFRAPRSSLKGPLLWERWAVLASQTCFLFCFFLCCLFSESGWVFRKGSAVGRVRLDSWSLSSLVGGFQPPPARGNRTGFSRRRITVWKLNHSGSEKMERYRPPVTFPAGRRRISRVS